MFSSPLVGIIGGLGRMGSWFKNQLEKEKYQVLISDLDTSLSNIDLAQQCDVLLISVPMPIFKKVIKEISPYLSPEKGLIDLCSLKKEPTQIMLDYTPCEIVAAHPLFGPIEKNLRQQKVAMWPARGKKWFQWFYNFIKKQKGIPIIISPQEHDEAMAIIQVLNHFMLLALSQVIENSAVSLEKIKALATPSFIRQLDILARFADQDPFLYGYIQFDNPAAYEARKKYVQAAQYLAKIAHEHNMKKFVDLFQKAQKLGEKIRKVKN